MANNTPTKFVPIPTVAVACGAYRDAILATEAARAARNAAYAAVEAALKAERDAVADLNRAAPKEVEARNIYEKAAALAGIKF